jgi:hypothetical protein
VGRGGCDLEIDGVRYWLAILVLPSIFDANLFVQVILARFCAHSACLLSSHTREPALYGEHRNEPDLKPENVSDADPFVVNDYDRGIRSLGIDAV